MPSIRTETRQQGSPCHEKTTSEFLGENTRRILTPVSDTYVDRHGRQIQLWYDEEAGELLAGALDKANQLRVFGPESLRNTFNPREDGHALLRRIGSVPAFPRDLAFAEVGGNLYLCPQLRAAGDDTKYPTFVKPFAGLNSAGAELACPISSDQWL